MKLLRIALFALVGLLTAGVLTAEEPFSKTVGDVTVGDVKAGTLEVPYITWGGDVATFMANGGKGETKADALFGKQGLKLNLVPGDNFVGQVKNYLEGKSPFLRGTMSQLGQASEVIGKNDKTKPVVFLQLTWSAGDHMVSRDTCKTLNDLKGKKIALQKGGPHVGMLNDILNTAKLTWKDITPVWTDDVTGDKGPAAKFRADKSIDACFVISPDMDALTGGLDKTGDADNPETGRVKGAKVLVSTAHMSRSIADVYACRKDFYDAHKDIVEKFVAAYLKASEDLVDLRKKWDAKKNKASDKKYEAVLKMTQEIYGKEVIPEEKDAHGLIMDASLVGLPGNVSFFTDAANLSGFGPKLKAALDLAVGEGYAKDRIEPAKHDLSYDKLKKLGTLDQSAEIVPPPSPLPDKIDVDKNTDKDQIYSFVIHFGGGKVTFPPEKYGTDFQRALEEASLFGNSVIAIRGHVNPSPVLGAFVTAAVEKGILTQKGKDFVLKDGSKLDLSDTKKVLALIQKEDFTKLKAKDPKQVLADAQKISEDRAAAVREEIIKYAKAKNLRLDVGQIRSTAVGIAEPLVPLPTSEDEAGKNRRVEFRLLKVAPEVLKPADFSF